MKQIVRFPSWENGGEGGIRTPGTLRYNGFQDRRIRPLCHLSVLAPSATVGLANLPEIIGPFSRKQRLKGIWILLKSGIITLYSFVDTSIDHTEIFLT